MKRMNFKIFIASLFLLASAMPSWAQSPSKNLDLTKRNRQERLKILRVPLGCQKSFQKTLATLNEEWDGIEFYKLHPKQYIVEVTCYSGAYQPGMIFIYYDETKRNFPVSRLLKLKKYEVDEKGRVASYYTSKIDGFSEFNEKKKALEIFSKSRGPGDCGSLVVYGFTNGRAFVKEARAQPCYEDDRDRSIDPHAWKKITKL
jgi:hypothetical protein